MSSGKEMVLRITAERSRCCGYGLCAQLGPQIYKLDENGLVYMDSETFSLDLEEEAREGAASCPAEALRVELVPA
jgi:ferredoxin